MSRKFSATALYELRKKQRLSQMDLAYRLRACGVPKAQAASISRYEKQDIVPSANSVIALADALRVPVDHLFVKEGDE